MGFQPKQFQDILQRMINRVVARSELTDVIEGGGVHSVLSAIAREIDGTYFEMTNLMEVWDIDTATGDELDLRAEDIPGGIIVREGEAKALTTAVFGRAGTSGAVSIPIGTIFRVPEGGPAFQTTSAGTIPDLSSTSATIPAQALEAGEAGNADVNTADQLDGIPGVETVYNNTAASGGQDEESDAHLRDRLRTYYRTLARGTEDALVGAALNVAVDGFGSVVTAQSVTFPGIRPGEVELYIDDGFGTVERIEDNSGTPETVVASAAGGEKRFSLGEVPVHEGYTISLEINAAAIVRDVDYRLDPTSGLVILDETLYPSGLTALDTVTGEYTWYVGLIEEVQKVIYGDPTDRANYPGYGADGIQVFVLAPATTQLVITAVIAADTTYQGELSTLKDKVKSALIRYVNGLGIGQDVIWSELIFAAQSIPGVQDIEFTNPTANVTVGDGELIRVRASNIAIT